MTIALVDLSTAAFIAAGFVLCFLLLAAIVWWENRQFAEQMRRDAALRRVAREETEKEAKIHYLEREGWR